VRATPEQATDHTAFPKSELTLSCWSDDIQDLYSTLALGEGPPTTRQRPSEACTPNHSDVARISGIQTIIQGKSRGLPTLSAKRREPMTAGTTQPRRGTRPHRKWTPFGKRRISRRLVPQTGSTIDLADLFEQWGSASPSGPLRAAFSRGAAGRTTKWRHHSVLKMRPWQRSRLGLDVRR